MLLWPCNFTIDYYDRVGKLPSIQLAQANLEKYSASNNTSQVMAKIPIVSITKMLRNYNHYNHYNQVFGCVNGLE